MTIDQNSVKGRIVKAAWDLFYEKGYDDTTIDDIIQASETSKGSFYYYFSRKQDLLQTLSVMLDAQYEILENEIEENMNSFEKLLLLNYKLHFFIEKKINLDLLASLYSAQLIAKGESSLLDRNRKYYRLIAGIIEEGQKREEITKDKTIQDIMKYYSLCERALVSDWCINRGSSSLAEYSKEYMPIMMKYFKN